MSTDRRIRLTIAGVRYTLGRHPTVHHENVIDQFTVMVQALPDADSRAYLAELFRAKGKREMREWSPDTTPKQWLIWSHEHNAYWRPGRQGYINDSDLAGRYAHDDAQAICLKAMRSSYFTRTGVPPELMVPAPEITELKTQLERQNP